MLEDTKWLQTQGYLVHHFDVTDWYDLTRMHDELKAKLAFPSYYGKNLDALNDCLSDIAIPNDAGTALTFSHFNSLATVRPTVATALLDIMADSSRRAMLFGRRLIVLVQTDSPKFSTGPIGTMTGNWNWREFLDSSREQ